MTTKTYDDFQELNCGFDFIPAKELESRLESIKESDNNEGGIFAAEIELIESIIAQFKANGDSVSDLTRYSEFNRSWMWVKLEEKYSWNTNSLPECVRNNIDFNGVLEDLLGEMNTVEIDGTTYYYEES